MEFSDYKKLTIDSEIYFNGEKKKIFALISGENIEIKFWGPPISYYKWSEIYQDCSLTPPVEKKNIKLYAYIMKAQYGVFDEKYEANLFYTASCSHEDIYIRVPQFDIEIEI